MSKNLDILREITESVDATRSQSAGAGRYNRTPDFSAPAFQSSRPKSDRGTTFHFSHKTISGARNISDGNQSRTPSAAHQGYIERPSAVERSDPHIVRSLSTEAFEFAPEASLHPGFSYPKRVVDERVISFGTLGRTKAERKDFWNQVEAAEGRRSRVQHRIIAELPAELDAQDRSLISRDFCQVFEDRALPYWAVVHAPGRSNDPRNFHLHITYFDRPSGQNADERWDFSLTERSRSRCRHTTIRRPYKNSKDADVRSIHWCKRLRRNFADTCNFYLSLAGAEKRLDPRSYRAAGVLKEPTEHLGNKLSALEGFGLETEPGQRNARREIRWRFAVAERPWITRVKALIGADHLHGEPFSQTRNTLEELASDGITAARQATSYDVTAGLIEERFTARRQFLSEESERLSNGDDMARFNVRSQTVAALEGERSILEGRAPVVERIAEKCRDESGRLFRTESEMAQRFDDLMNRADPDALFLADHNSDFVPIDQLAPAKEDERSRPEVVFDEAELEQISTILDEISPPRTDLDRAKKADLDPKDQEVAEPRKPHNPIEQIIARLANGDHEVEPMNPGTSAVIEFPGAWPIQAPRSDLDIGKIEARLLGMDNRTLRQTAIANRDATDISPPGDSRDAHNRGWVVLRFEARRRGLDLDTGAHHPDQATDPNRARLHLDQDRCPIRVLRKNLARERVRT